MVTNLSHYSSNVAIRHNDTMRRCDGDVTLRRDFALSRHNSQRCKLSTPDKKCLQNSSWIYPLRVPRRQNLQLHNPTYKENYTTHLVPNSFKPGLNERYVTVVSSRITETHVILAPHRNGDSLSCNNQIQNINKVKLKTKLRTFVSRVCIKGFLDSENGERNGT
jgi:hypothetical protein